MLQIEWIKCGSGKNWCPFETVDLDGVTTKGVYVIWHQGNPARTVYVGQGDVKARLCQHRNDARITKHANSGTLRVTWASVPAAQRDGVERYLADYYNPLVGDAHPAALPIQVNLVA